MASVQMLQYRFQTQGGAGVIVRLEGEKARRKLGDTGLRADGGEARKGVDVDRAGLRRGSGWRCTACTRYGNCGQDLARKLQLSRVPEAPGQLDGKLSQIPGPAGIYLAQGRNDFE